MSFSSIQVEARNRLAELFQTGSISDLEEEASRYIESHQEREDEALPTALDLLQRIQQLAPSAPIPGDLARGIQQVEQAIHSEQGLSQMSEDNLTDFLYNLGHHLASRWPAVGQPLLEATQPRESR